MSLAQLIRKQNPKTSEKKKPKQYKKKDVTSNLYVSNIEKNKKSIDIFNRESEMQNLVITSISYSVMSRDFIDRQSVCEITTINKKDDQINTTDDPRLGTIANNKLCSTCEKTNLECPGHLGVIKLPVSIIHPFFRIATMRVLQCICNTCNKLLLSEKYIKESGIEDFKGFSRLLKIAEQSKDGKIRCTNGCQPNFIFKPQKSGLNETRNMSCVKKIGKREIPIFLTVEKIENMFETISDKDASLLGFINNHPKNFIVDFIPVIPLSARPYVYRDLEAKDDYITSTYMDIISKKIESYQTSMDFNNNENQEEKKEECYDRIIYLYDHLIQNCDQTHRRSPTDICKSISDRMVGKESLIRGHMMGKRADFTGRTVLGPNRSINFGEIAPPKVMMEKLTVSERVTKYNIDYFLNLSKENKIDYLCPCSGMLAGRKLKYDKEKHIINIGDKIGRFSEDGDVVIFNRQPTLHKQSMLGYICKFQDKLSVGLHLASTKGHNADFDGDEGNIHMLQTISSQVEGRLLMYAGNAMMSSSSPHPVEALTINSPAGAYLLTDDKTYFNQKEYQEGLDSIYKYTNNDYVKNNFSTLFERLSQFPEINKYSGKSLCSVLFPHDFVYNYNENKNNIIIRNGVLIRGRLTAAHVGPQTGSIIQSLWKRYGYRYASNFISNASFLFNWFAQFYGMTISLKDITPLNKEEFRKYKIKEINKLNDFIIDYQKLNENNKDLDNDVKEMEISQFIVNTQETIQKKFFEKYLEKSSSLQTMIKSKSKGTEIQVAFTSGFLMQQWINSGRPTKMSTNGKRWLPTFDVNDNSIFSRGFCENSYVEGINPNEFFAQAQAARISVTDTAVKTSETGTLHRRMTKAQQDLVVQYDGSVRNNNNIIFQFNFGSGISATSSVYSNDAVGNQTISFINMKELCTEINSANGYFTGDIYSNILEEFNKINSKYGDDLISFEKEENVVNDMDNYTEVTENQDDDFEANVDE